MALVERLRALRGKADRRGARGEHHAAHLRLRARVEDVARSVDGGPDQLVRVGREVAVRCRRMNDDVGTIERRRETLAIEDVAFAHVDRQPIEGTPVRARTHQRDHRMPLFDQQPHDVRADVTIRPRDDHSHRAIMPPERSRQ